MKTGLLIALVLLSTASMAQQVPTVNITQQQSRNVFTGVFSSVWARLRSMNPTARHSAQSAVTYTAGIRGAEATGSLLQPYWKGDLTEDPGFQKQINAFQRAQNMLDQGQLEQGLTEIQQFVRDYPGSALMPNALFSVALSQAATGDTAARNTLELFIRDYPNHPLVTDAQFLLQQLGG